MDGNYGESPSLGPVQVRRRSRKDSELEPHLISNRGSRVNSSSTNPSISSRDRLKSVESRASSPDDMPLNASELLALNDSVSSPIVDTHAPDAVASGTIFGTLSGARPVTPSDSEEDRPLVVSHRSERTLSAEKHGGIERSGSFHRFARVSASEAGTGVADSVLKSLALKTGQGSGKVEVLRYGYDDDVLTSPVQSSSSARAVLGVNDDPPSPEPLRGAPDALRAVSAPLSTPERTQSTDSSRVTLSPRVVLSPSPALSGYKENLDGRSSATPSFYRVPAIPDFSTHDPTVRLNLPPKPAKPFFLGMEGALKSIRTKVSQSKRRYTEGDFNLDLTYITPRVSN
jgi:hypothetical protein